MFREDVDMGMPRAPRGPGVPWQHENKHMRECPRCRQKWARKESCEGYQAMAREFARNATPDPEDREGQPHMDYDRTPTPVDGTPLTMADLMLGAR